MRFAKRNLLLAVAVVFTLGFILPAQGFSAEVKIGFVSIQKVLFGCKGGEDAGKKLKEKQSSLMAGLQKINDEGQNLQAEIAKKQSVWSADRLEEKQRKLEKLQREMKLQQEDARYEMVELKKKLLNPILTKLDPILKEYGKANGYSMIVDADVAARSGLVVYGEPSLDISKDLIEKLNAQL